MQNPDFISKDDDYPSDDKIPPLRCSIEVHQCRFCNFKDDTRSSMEDHYYFKHEKELGKIPGGHLCRKIDLLITNSDKSFVPSLLCNNDGEIKKEGARGGNFS